MSTLKMKSRAHWMRMTAISMGALAAVTIGGAAVGARVAGVPGALVGACLGALFIPGDTVAIRGEGRELARIAKEQGIPRDALRRALEKIKDSAGLRGDENVDILPDGTVMDMSLLHI